MSEPAASANGGSVIPNFFQARSQHLGNVEHSETSLCTMPINYCPEVDKLNELLRQRLSRHGDFFISNLPKCLGP